MDLRQMITKIAAMLTLGVVFLSPLALAQEPKKPTSPSKRGEQERFIRLTSQQLLSDTQKWDGKKISFRGEIIGDIMPRGDFVWFNVQDEFGTIGIWAPRDLMGAVEHTGDYRYAGDTIEIEGKFFRADPKLAGELCVRAQKLRIINRGRLITHPLNVVKVEIAAIFSIGVLILSLLRIFIKRKSQSAESL